MSHYGTAFECGVCRTGIFRVGFSLLYTGKMQDYAGMTKIKNLCDLDKKDIEKNLTELIPLVSKPKYICSKCARVAADSDLLCKAIKFKRIKI